MTDAIQHTEGCAARTPRAQPTKSSSRRTASLRAQVARGRPSRRWGRRRVLGLAAPALAAAATPIVLGITLTERERRAGASCSGRAASPQSAPTTSRRRRRAGASRTYGRFSVDYGEITLAASGKRELKVHWLPVRRASARARRERLADSTTSVPPGGGRSRLGSSGCPGTDEYVAVWLRGDYMVEAQGRAPDVEAFRDDARLAARGRTSQRWLDSADAGASLRVRYRAMPTRPGKRASAVAEMRVFARPADGGGRRCRDGSTTGSSRDRARHSARPTWGCIGSNSPARSRLLLSDLGQRKEEALRLADHGGLCVLGLGQRRRRLHTRLRARRCRGFRCSGATPIRRVKASLGAIVGIVPDDVIAVAIGVNGVRYPAIVSNNGFFFELPECAVHLGRDRLHHGRPSADGTYDAPPPHDGRIHRRRTLPLCRGAWRTARRPRARERRAARRP